MIFTLRSKLHASLLATSAVGALVLAAPAMAAEPATAPAAADAADASAGLETIVVTAQKRKENLQSTPISISVLTGAGLENRHVVSLGDLGDGSIPSLKVAPFYSRNSALIVNIRGVGVLSDSNQPARDQGVGVYIDGVYLGRAQGLGTALFEVENLEVLKGPQGTLFGRNTEGGAVNITSKKPTGQFGMTTTLGMGNYGAYKGEIHLNLPETNNVSVKVDGVVSHRDGLVKNPLQGATDFNAYDKRGLHVEALWKATPSFTADYSFDISYDSSTPLYLQLLSTGTNTQATLGTVQATRASVANVGVPQQPSVGKASGHRLSLDWQVAPKLTLKSITSYRQLDQSQYDNGSASTTMSNASGVFTNATIARYSLAGFRQNQVAQEFQAIGELPQLKYVAGALWYQERVEDSAAAFYTNTLTDAAGSATSIIQYPVSYDAKPKDRASHVATTSAGLFGQATYTPAFLGDVLHLTGGLRWTRDMKHGALFTVNGASPVVFGVSGQVPLNAAWTRVDPMVNLAFDVSKNNMVYAKWGTGYRSGGANSRSLTYRAFNPESVSLFEIGTKNEFFDHHVRLNASAYAGAYKNIQVDFSGAYETVINGVFTRSTRTTTETINAPGTGGLKGFEAELAVNPVKGLTFTASLAHTIVHIPNTVNPFPSLTGVYNTNAEPVYAQYTPKSSFSLGGDYEAPLKGFTLRLHLDGNYDSGYYQGAYDVAYNTTTGAVTVAQPKGDAAFITNGRLAFANIAMGNTGAKLTASVWARNLLNESHVFYRALSTTSGYNGFFNDPRTFGAEITVKY
jgi:iron complex outermembrane receptor protein